MSLIETLSAVAIASIVSLATASLIQTTVDSSSKVQGRLEYANLVSLTSKFLDGATSCEEVFEPVIDGVATNMPAYTGANDVNLPGVSLAGAEYIVGRTIPGTRVQIDSITLRAAPEPGINTTVFTPNPAGGAPVEIAATRFITTLEIAASRGTRNRDAAGGQAKYGYKIIPIPMLIYTDAANEIKVCAGNDDAQSCQQIGGDYIAGTDNGTPLDQTDDIRPECDISDVVTENSPGGCAIGGTFTLINNNCSSVNPYTGGCNCPPDFAAATVIDYNLVKGAALVQKQCMNCAGGGAGADSGEGGDLLYSEAQLEQDLACLQGNTAVCPCADPASVACICSENPATEGCDDPCHTQGATSLACCMASAADSAAQTACVIGAFGSGGAFGIGFIGGEGIGL